MCGRSKMEGGHSKSPAREILSVFAHDSPYLSPYFVPPDPDTDRQAACALLAAAPTSSSCAGARLKAQRPRASDRLPPGAITSSLLSLSPPRSAAAAIVSFSSCTVKFAGLSSARHSRLPSTPCRPVQRLVLLLLLPSLGCSTFFATKARPSFPLFLVLYATPQVPF
jgi:hypothetical protein